MQIDRRFFCFARELLSSCLLRCGHGWTYEKQQQPTNPQNRYTRECTHTRVCKTRIKQIRAHDAEQNRRERVERHAKRTADRRVFAPKHEESDSSKQEEKPEDGGRIVHHGLEALSCEDA